MNSSEEILYISFNQSQENFVCGTTSGFKVYQTTPLQEIHSKDLNGGIGIVEMLYKTNVYALVGGGPNPKYPPNQVIIWDNSRSDTIGEMSFKSAVKAIRITLKKIVVVIETKIYIHHLIDLSLMDRIDIANNPKGLCCFSLKEDLICFPDEEIGQVKLKFYNADIHTADDTNSKVLTTKAHSTALFYMKLSGMGELLATASEKGTLIRVFRTKTGELLQELRRGIESYQIFSISFSFTSEWLACTSDTGTVHIFRLNETKGDELSQNSDETKPREEIKNTTSKLAFMKVFHNYFGSEWSFSHIKKLSDKKTKVIFGPDKQQIIVVAFDGKYYHIAFDSKENGGSKMLHNCNFLKPIESVSQTTD